jgi:hypothetical protein
MKKPNTPVLIDYILNEEIRENERRREEGMLLLLITK